MIGRGWVQSTFRIESEKHNLRLKNSMNASRRLIILYSFLINKKAQIINSFLNRPLSFNRYYMMKRQCYFLCIWYKKGCGLLINFKYHFEKKRKKKASNHFFFKINTSTIFVRFYDSCWGEVARQTISVVNQNRIYVIKKIHKVYFHITTRSKSYLQNSVRKWPHILFFSKIFQCLSLFF